MVTDQKFRELEKKYEELSKKYEKMSKDIGNIMMRLDLVGPEQSASPSMNKRDVTKYIFKGKQYSKRDLVLECVKTHIKDKGIKSAKELFEIFPDGIQGSLGVFKNVYDAEKYSNADEHFFFNDEDILILEEGSFAVCKDWTAQNIGVFLDVAETLNYEIKSVYRNK